MSDDPSDELPNDADAMEECLDEIDDFLGTLQRFSDPVIALSLRMHLAALLRAMAASGGCSPEDVREFVAALEHEALAPETDEDS
jgi:hypothetical protein